MELTNTAGFQVTSGSLVEINKGLGFQGRFSVWLFNVHRGFACVLFYVVASVDIKNSFERVDTIFLIPPLCPFALDARDTRENWSKMFVGLGAPPTVVNRIGVGFVRFVVNRLVR